MSPWKYKLIQDSVDFKSYLLPTWAQLAPEEEMEENP